MKKHRIKSLSLVKQVISNLTEEQSNRVKGGNTGLPTGKTRPTVPTRTK